MPLSPVGFREFRGLDLAHDPFDVGPERAVDMLDVELTPDGGIRARDRHASATAGLTLTNFHHMASYDYQDVYYGPSVIGFRMSGANVVVNEFNVTSGGVYTADQRQSIATVSQPVSSTVVWGSPGAAENAMILAYADSTVLSVLTYNGLATWTNLLSVGSGRPRWIVGSPTDNRLVQARFTDPTWSPTGANGSLTSVFFSDPGAPGSYNASNWVELRPMDGEEITGLVTWRENVVAFKETVMFIFTGTSTLSSGAVQFNYRPVTLPGRLQSNVVVGPQGMYFVTAEGVYVTDGIRFTRISQDIQGVFDLSVQDTAFRPGTALPTGPPYFSRPFHLAFARDRLYLNFDPTGGTWTTLIYDTANGYWIRHGYQAVHVLDAPGNFASVDGGPSLIINRGNVSSPGVYYTEPGDTEATSPYWRSGWFDFDSHEEKFIRETVIHAGYGTTLTYNLGTEGGVAVAAAASLSAGAMGDHYFRTAARGRRFYHSVQGAGDFRLSGITHYLRGSKIPGASVT